MRSKANIHPSKMAKPRSPAPYRWPEVPVASCGGCVWRASGGWCAHKEEIRLRTDPPCYWAEHAMTLEEAISRLEWSMILARYKLDPQAEIDEIPF